MEEENISHQNDVVRIQHNAVSSLDVIGIPSSPPPYANDSKEEETAESAKTLEIVSREDLGPVERNSIETVKTIEFNPAKQSNNLMLVVNDSKEAAKTETDKSLVIDANVEPNPTGQKDEVVTMEPSHVKDPEMVKPMEPNPVDQEGSDMVEIVESHPVEQSGNLVLRKLLRGPRYFDPPDSSWGMCYKCGKEGHRMAKCTALKQKKPCFVCGSLEHGSKKCTKGHCFYCRQGGHRMKNCPEKNNGVVNSSNICLRCGDSGHDMFSCEHGYSPDDLKEIQCYACKSFGHICCVNFIDAGPRKVSCYKCGHLGHSGVACVGSRGEQKTVGTQSSSSCYKCGDEGHFALECTSSAKVGKRGRGISRPRWRVHKDDKNYSEFMSEPHNLVKRRRKKEIQYEENSLATPSKSKRRGGWITEDPEDVTFPHSKSKPAHWRSLSTPTNKRRKFHKSTSGGESSGSRSFRKARKLYSGTPNSQGSTKALQHQFSASRFHNYQSHGRGRNY